MSAVALLCKKGWLCCNEWSCGDANSVDEVRCVGFMLMEAFIRASSRTGAYSDPDSLKTPLMNDFQDILFALVVSAVWIKCDERKGWAVLNDD